MTDYSTMVSMPLKAAYLCEDCHCVGNCSTGCIACASRALLSLKGVLNREPQELSGPTNEEIVTIAISLIDDLQTGEQPHSD